MAVLSGTQVIVLLRKSQVLLRLKQMCFINLSDTMTNQVPQSLNDLNHLTSDNT